MTRQPLSDRDMELLRGVFRRHPEISRVKMFGSRAKGTHLPSSDIDLALWGQVDALGAQRIAGELDDLPLPYQYDVIAFEHAQHEGLRQHIERVGIQIYPVVVEQ